MINVLSNGSWWAIFKKNKCFWSKTSLINLSGLFLIEQKWSKTFLSTFFVWWPKFLINCFWSIVFDQFYFDELKLLIKMFLIIFFDELNLLINFFLISGLFWWFSLIKNVLIKNFFNQKKLWINYFLDQQIDFTLIIISLV